MDRQVPKQQPGGKPQQVALKQALATTLTVTSQIPVVSQCTPSSPQLLAHLTAPQSIRGSSTAFSFHFPFTISSLSPVTCTQAVGRLVYSQPVVSLASTGFTVVSPSSSIPALQVLGSNTFQSHLSSTGMMMVPTLAAGQVKVSSSVTSGPSFLSTNLPEASSGVPVILQSQHSAPELNFILTSPGSQLQQQPSLLPANSRSFSGTVHHKGISGSVSGEGSISKPHMIQSPAKELSFVHLKSQLKQESSFSLIAKSKRPRSDSVGVKSFGPFESSSSLLDELGGELPPAKKIKLETELSDDSEVSTYRKLYCDDREKELEKKAQDFQALVMELFFLENGGHMMDYFGWQKRSGGNSQLMRYLRSRKAEDLGEYGGQEKSINNEVKVLTTSGGTLPIVTPVAISKTLPPAITAMQQQQQQENAGNSNGNQLMSRKAGGRHGMVYGYVSPKAIQQCPLVPGGIPLSTTAATTTVGSPPPYTVECSSSSSAVVTIVAVTTTTITMTSALSRARPTEGICQPTIGTGSCHVTDVYQPSLMARVQLSESHRGQLLPVTSDLGLPETSSSSSATLAISQEAVVELAKQEAQVMQRVAELRKQGLWSLKQLPKVQEPTRHKSHWDYLLDEMQWMAVDFAQERRWKMACAKHIAVSITKQHDRRQQNLKLRQKAEEQKMKALACAVGKMITNFWSNMIEMALYKRHKDVELKHRRLLNYVTRDAVNSPLESAENEVTCEQETSAKAATDDQHGSSEIDDLIKEGEMPLDELMQKYSGAYSKEFEDDFLQLQADSPASSSCSSSKKNGSSDGENAAVEDVDVVEADSTGSPKVVMAVTDPIEQMIRTALSLQPTSNTCDLDTVDRCASSSFVKLKLRDYQIVGTNWVSAMHQHRIGCILADEKGLGKKVQVIHFLSSLASEQGNWGPHLIVGPSGSLFIWQMIFSRWCPALKMFVYCGDVQERIFQRLKWMSSECGHFNVCLTSYKCLAEDAQFFSEQTWNCLILDQADAVDSSEVARQLRRLSTEHRLLLTDLSLKSIPLKQVFDLIVLAFSANLYRDFRERFGYLLPKDFSLLESGTQEYNDLNKIVHEIANVLSLRRCKEDMSGQLPKLEITTVHCPLTKRQQLLYSQLISSDETKDVLCAGHLADVLSLTLKLKMICNHPDLLEGSCAALLPLVVDGVPLSMPSLLDGVLHKDSLHTTGAWSAVTSLAQLEKDASAGRSASFSSKQKPLIEELPSGSAAKAEGAMDIDVETTDFTDLPGGGGGDAPTKLRSLSPSEMGKKEELPADPVLDDDIKALYGVNLQSLLRSMTSELAQKHFECGQWSSQGYLLCSLDGRTETKRNKTTLETEATDSFISLLSLSSECAKNLSDAVAPFCPSRVVVQPGRTTVPSDSAEQRSLALEDTLRSLTAEKKVPKPRSQLTLANSGKLQLLDLLMKQLISDQRRVVILSHMTRLLDLLETYLDTCMLLYVRIDGSTKAEKRHQLVQRFNTNPKICCLLMSSRASFLPGCEWPCADAVVLFDVDLSPSMKRHADQMLHAMAQSSSLTVFRFVTQDTVEELLFSHEGILQKGVVSHAGATCTQETLSRLFRKSSLVEELDDIELPLSNPADDNLIEFPEEMFECALNSVEDAEDVEAGLLVKAQRDVSGTEGDGETVLRILKADADKSVSPDTVKLSEIEEYAVSFIERNLEMLSKNIIKQEDDDHETLLKVANPNKRKLDSEVKTDLEMEEKMARELEKEEEDDDLLLTYPMDRENKQVFVSDVTGEQMPLWMPPTPPQDDSDVYVDISLHFLYEPSVMSESQLPQVYVKKGHKRMKTDNTITRRMKVHREEQQLAPRSLFERPLALVRCERESRLLKQSQMKGLKSSAMVPVRPMPEPPSDQPDWLIHEDWALLQAYQMHQDLPIVSSLEVLSTHSSNWEVISDIVNVCSRTYRTPKQCKNRFDNVILPREEGKFLYDINPRKLKKSNKGLYKTKNNQPMRTNQLYVQDNSRAMTTCFMLHIEALKSLPPKRSTALTLTSSTTIGGTRNTKHIAALADLNLNYDQPVSPLQIAAMRAERLAKDKKQTPAPATTVSTGDQQPVMPSVVNTQLRLTTQQAPGTPVVIQTGQQPAQAILQTQQQLVQGQHVVPATPAAVVSTPLAGHDNRQQQMTIVQATGQQLQAVASVPSALLTTSLHKVVGSTASGVTSVSLPRNLTMAGIVVTQASGLNRPQTVVTSAALVNLPTNLNQTVRAIRNVVPLTIRDAAAPAISHSTINISAQDARSLAQVIATTGLTTTQLVVTQQKPAVGLPQLSAAPLPETPPLLSSVSASTRPRQRRRAMSTEFIKHLLEDKTTGSVQQQMLNLTGTTKSQNAATIPTLQVQMRQQRVGTGTAILQQGRPVHLMQNQMTALLRKQPQAKTATAAATGTVQGSLNIQQIPRQQQQQIEGVTLQQQQQLQQPQQQGVANSAVTQSVTTLLKAVSPAASLSTVTIPVSAMSLGINMTHPKLVSGKAANSPQQLRQLQVPKRVPAVQFAASRMPALGPMAKSVSSSPVILQQQKFLPQPLSTRYQHLISSSPGTVIAAQIIHQSNAQPSMPASVTVAAASSKASVTVTIAGSAGLSGVATIPMSSLCQVTNATVVSTAVKVIPTPAMMYAKQNKDTFLGIQKTTMVVPAGLQQLTVRPATAQQQQQQQQQTASSQLLQGAHITMATSNKGVASLTPVEKAVAEVVQQAQAQARQVPPISFSGSTVVASASQGSSSQAQVVSTVPVPQHLLVTSVVPQPATGPSLAAAGAVSAASPAATGADDPQQNKSSTSYVMKLRNQRS